jgi:hypothetical protein
VSATNWPQAPWPGRSGTWFFRMVVGRSPSYSDSPGNAKRHRMLACEQHTLFGSAQGLFRPLLNSDKCGGGIILTALRRTMSNVLDLPSESTDRARSAPRAMYENDFSHRERVALFHRLLRRSRAVEARWVLLCIRFGFDSTCYSAGMPGGTTTPLSAPRELGATDPAQFWARLEHQPGPDQPVELRA